MQLSAAINVAKKTHSVLMLPKHEFIRQRTLDFRDSGNKNCNLPVVGRFLIQSDCFQFPIKYDYERRLILQEYVLEDLLRKTLLERVRSQFSSSKKLISDSDTLVINIRSGKDIFRDDPPPQNDYMQPPLSFYKYVIDTNNYEKCLIVTEADRENPVLSELLAWNTNIHIKTHEGVRSDIASVLHAKHLIAAHSSFTWCLALMSKNLRVLHQPATCQIRGVTDYEINTYEIDNYIQPGEWKATQDQLKLMIDHSVDDVRLLVKTDNENTELTSAL